MATTKTTSGSPQVEFIRTDPDRPPVALRGRRPTSPGARVVYALIAILGAVGWAMVAIVRGEHINSVWLVAAAVCTYIIAFRFYARLIEYKVVRPKDERGGG